MKFRIELYDTKTNQVGAPQTATSKEELLVQLRSIMSAAVYNFVLIFVGNRAIKQLVMNRKKGTWRQIKLT